MMDTKIRNFAPLPRDAWLEDSVPEDHFYRRLEARLDLSFVRELVETRSLWPIIGGVASCEEGSGKRCYPGPGSHARYPTR
jgi:hypothetical protein